MNVRCTGHHITRRIKLIACISALGTAFVVALPQVIGHAFGSQDYVCAASGTGVAFVLTTPEAVLFDNPAHRVINHFFSPNPVEGGTIRATWQSTRNSSVFWGQAVAIATADTDPDFVAPDAIAWVTLSRARCGQVRSTSEYRGRAGPVDRLQLAGRHQEDGVCALRS